VSSLDTYTSLLLITVDGIPLPATAANLLVTGQIIDSANLPDSFELEFTDSAGAVLVDGGFHIGAPVELVVSENGPQGPVRLLDGEVTAIDREDVAGVLRTRVRGLDRSHRLFRGRRVAAYIDRTPADIVREVAERAHVPVKEITVKGSVIPHATQDNVSDWVFLKRLADATGSTFSVVEGGLVFGPPTEASAAPGGAESARDDPVVIEHGMNTLSLLATITSASQVLEVEVRGWDVERKEAVVSTAPPRTHAVELSTLDPESVAGTFPSPTHVSPNGDGRPAEQDRMAASVADRIAGGFAEVEARIRGNSRIRSGTAVTLRGFGAPFDGRYTATETVHEFAADTGYTTVVVVSNASDRSLLGVATGGMDPAAGPASTRMPGVIPAVVSDIDDPQGRGRVRLTFPQLSADYVSGWARTVQAGAGANRGGVVMPEVGDEVLVTFDTGRFDRPYVLGGLFNGVDEPSGGWAASVKSGEVRRRSFTSRTGMNFVFVEEPGAERVEISTSEGQQRLTLTQTGQQGIEILSEGPVAVTAKSDATISADQGKLTISAASLDITASGAVNIEGASVTVKGSGPVAVEGATVAVKGQAAAELSASGVTTVRGTIVKIN